jgi:hypothetical protein
VGASTWASGSQVWNGHIGTFTAKETNMASQRICCTPSGSGFSRSFAVIAGMSVVPVVK